MESLFHGIFELLKISILSFIYSHLIILIFKSITKTKTGNFYQKIIEPKRRLWVIIAVLLFFFTTTNIGSHGLGDSANIPISFTKSVSNIDWVDYGTIKNASFADGSTIETTRWKVKSGKLCGEMGSNTKNLNKAYFIYNIENEQVTEYSNAEEYNKIATNLNLPMSTELLNFQENYTNYWRGWRFWFLP